ncbi:MAG: peptidylprolyl isomerase [Thermoprotei archaeon]|nr:peptidylprolyl isomerase [Thermoprotei archaeon]
MPFNKGDFLLVDYVAKVKDEDRILETTIAEEAKKAGIYDENKAYEPKLIILGEGWLLKSVEDEILNMDIGEEKVIELPPEKAFGERDPSKVRVIPARELTRRRIRPVLGAQIEINGRIGLVRSVGSGRVVVDFNHPLAGRTLIYKVKVVKKLESLEERIRALIHTRLPSIEAGKFKIEIKDGDVTIWVPEEALNLDGLQIFKRALAMDVRRYIEDISLLRFIEEFKVREETKEPQQEQQ